MDHTPSSVLQPDCEFCLSAPAEKTYVAAPLLFRITRSIAVLTEPAWRACAICAVLIDAGRWDDLADRVTRICILHEGARAVYPDFREQSLLKQKVRELLATIREAIGRTA